MRTRANIKRKLEVPCVRLGHDRSGRYRVMTVNVNAINKSSASYNIPIRPSSIAFRLGLYYLLFTIALFVFGPFDWPLPSNIPVLLYLAALLFMLYSGHSVGLSRAPLHSPLHATKAIFIFGALSATLLLLPSSIIYTGRWPWQVLQALADQKEAYGKLGEQLAETQGGRGPIIAARTLTAPFVFAVLPLGVIYWRTMTFVQRSLLGLTILSSIIFSILRGTTRELADVVLIGGGAFLVSIYRDVKVPYLLAQRLRKFAVRMSVLVASVLVALVIRTSARAGDVVTATSGCIGETGVCVDYDKLPFSVLPLGVDNFFATITGYFSQGYYGLALALRQDFIWAKGVGHSPAIQSLYELMTGDPFLAQNSYTNRLVSDGWSGEYQWSSLPTWLASDMSFWLVPGALLFIGYLWARSWADATVGQDDRAAVFFCTLTMMIFYFPANNQMMNTLDNYAVLIGWGVAWAITRRNAREVVA